MSTAKKSYPSTHIQGRLTADPAVRTIPPKTEGQEARQILEFDVAVNPTREALEVVFVKAAIFGAKRIESAKAKLAKGCAVELSGDLKVRPYIHEGKPRASVEMEVSFGKLVVFGEAGEAPTKTSLFLFASEASEASE